MRWRSVFLVALLAACSRPAPPSSPGTAAAAPGATPAAFASATAPPPAHAATAVDGACLPDRPLKGGRGPAGERWYYLPHIGEYDGVRAEVCFASLNEAHEAGYGPPPD